MNQESSVTRPGHSGWTGTPTQPQTSDPHPVLPVRFTVAIVPRSL